MTTWLGKKKGRKDKLYKVLGGKGLKRGQCRKEEGGGVKQTFTYLVVWLHKGNSRREGGQSNHQSLGSGYGDRRGPLDLEGWVEEFSGGQGEKGIELHAAPVEGFGKTRKRVHLVAWSYKQTEPQKKESGGARKGSPRRPGGRGTGGLVGKKKSIVLTLRFQMKIGKKPGNGESTWGGVTSVGEVKPSSNWERETLFGGNAKREKTGDNS